MVRNKMSSFKRVTRRILSNNGCAWFVYYIVKLLGIGRMLSDKHYLQLMSRCTLGYSINLTKPQTFNEKIQWLKLYDRKYDYHKMVDKYEAKQYVSSIIGDKYIIRTYGVWNKVEDIVWKDLPDKFVIKTTGGSGGNDVIICKDKSKLDINFAINKLRRSLSEDVYWYGREECYRNNKNRIIAEELLEDYNNIAPADYKFLCFNGRVNCSFTCTNRYQAGGLKVTFYDREWKILPFERNHPREIVPMIKPANYNKMIELAEKLSVGIPFVRVDFYDINNSIYFGELTFYPGSGFEPFQPKEWDYILGEWLVLPNKKVYE